ncbi:MAG: tetratricopeptide repeat protein [Parvularculaceae bacterium]
MESKFKIKGEIKKEKSDLVICSEGAAYGEELEEALTACDTAVAEKPEDGDIRYYRGFVLFHMERFPDAEAAFTKAINLDARKKAESYYQRGVCKEKQRRLREAAGDFKKAADLKPEWSAARRKVKEYHWALAVGAE